VGEFKQRDGNQIEYSLDLQKLIVEDVKAPCNGKQVASSYTVSLDISGYGSIGIGCGSGGEIDPA
jgi:hypothetical protein